MVYYLSSVTAHPHSKSTKGVLLYRQSGILYQRYRLWFTVSLFLLLRDNTPSRRIFHTKTGREQVQHYYRNLQKLERDDDDICSQQTPMEISEGNTMHLSYPLPLPKYTNEVINVEVERHYANTLVTIIHQSHRTRKMKKNYADEKTEFWFHIIIIMW